MPSAPWLAAGRLSSGASSARMRCSSPSRINPAAARIIAVQAPASSARKRVSRLPRSGCTFRRGQCIQRKVAVTDKSVARVGALWDGRQLKASRQNGGHILERMYSQIGAAVGERLFKFLDEQTLASDL